MSTRPPEVPVGGDVPSIDAGDTGGTVEQDVAAEVVEQLTPLVPPQLLPQVQAIVDDSVAQITMHQHSGPLPRAQDLEAYNAVDASFAERIVRMAEKEQDRRHSLPTELLDREYRLKTRGQHYAFAIAALVLAFAGLLAWLGDTDMAGKVAIGTLIGLVSLFLGGRTIDAIDRRRDESDDDEAT